MSFEYFCNAILLLPDTPVGCIAPIAALAVFLGFVFIVVGSKKYAYLFKWFDDKFGKWY